MVRYNNTILVYINGSSSSTYRLSCSVRFAYAFYLFSVWLILQAKNQKVGEKPLLSISNLIQVVFPLALELLSF